MHHPLVSRSLAPRRIIRARADLAAELQKLGLTSEMFDAVLDQLILSRLIRVDGRRIWVVNRKDDTLQAIYPTPKE